MFLSAESFASLAYSLFSHIRLKLIFLPALKVAQRFSHINRRLRFVRHRIKSAFLVDRRNRATKSELWTAINKKERHLFHSSTLFYSVHREFRFLCCTVTVWHIHSFAVLIFVRFSRATMRFSANFSINFFSFCIDCHLFFIWFYFYSNLQWFRSNGIWHSSIGLYPICAIACV